MSAADFDDIFGEDPKMDATAAPTLTDVDLDDDELFGANPSGKVTKPGEAVSEQPKGQADWAQIGSHEQDEFLSWLDDGGSTQATPAENAPVVSLGSAPPPAPVPVAPQAATTFDNVSLDDAGECKLSAKFKPSNCRHRSRNLYICRR
jgi:hypothetical protein